MPLPAWPRRSNVRHTQPSPAMPLARSRSRSWLPPQPCTNNTPGTFDLGLSKVPLICSSSISIAMVSLLAVIRFNRHVLEKKVAVFRRAPVHLDRVSRQWLVDVGLYRRHMNRPQPGIVDEALQRRDFRAAGPAHAPGLLQHATAALAVAVQALGDVVIAPRGIEPRVGLIGSVIESLRLLDGQAHVVGQVELEQVFVIAL